MVEPVGDWRRDLEDERVMRDEFMARHAESPFVAERVPFRPLPYFPLDEKYRVPARLERREAPQEAYLRTNRDGQAVMRYLGDLLFTLEGRALRLRVYHAGEGVGTSVFVPFRDRTSGKSTYGPGRYLTLELNERDEYELDFNRAFNPYCAYTDEFECGFPPSENDLSVAIRAGEKLFALERNPRTLSAEILRAARRPSPAGSLTAPAAALRGRRRSAPPRPRASPQPKARGHNGR